MTDRNPNDGRRVVRGSFVQPQMNALLPTNVPGAGGQMGSNFELGRTQQVAAHVDETCSDLDSSGPDIYASAGSVLEEVIAVARTRADAHSFAQLIEFALDFRSVWTASDLADRFGVSESMVLKWRREKFAPIPVMRRVVMEDLRRLLLEKFGGPGIEGSQKLAGKQDLAIAARQLVGAEIRDRLSRPAAITDNEFAANLRASLEVGDYFTMSAVAAETNLSQSTISRWSTGKNLPGTLMRRGIVGFLFDEWTKKLAA